MLLFHSIQHILDISYYVSYILLGLVCWALVSRNWLTQVVLSIAEFNELNTFRAKLMFASFSSC